MDCDERAIAIAQLKEIASSFTTRVGVIKPESASFPRGKRFIVKRDFFLVAEELVLGRDRLWLLIFNNKEGDDITTSNVAGCYIGYFVKITAELKREFEELFAKAKAQQ